VWRFTAYGALWRFARYSITNATKQKPLHAPKDQKLEHSNYFVHALPRAHGLLGTIAPRTRVAIQLKADGGLVPIQQIGYLHFIVSGFHEGLNLTSLILA
jgi:hypothetical protein